VERWGSAVCSRRLGHCFAGLWIDVPTAIDEEEVALAVRQLERSRRRLATAIPDQRVQSVAGSQFHRLLDVRDLVTGRAFILMRAAERLAWPFIGLNPP
jgi:hypothetical protein